jgi:hypothetical protein
LGTAILMRVKFAFKEKINLLSTVTNDAMVSVNNCQMGKISARHSCAY